MKINNNQYKLYTDASRRTNLNGEPLCTIAGVLLNNKNKPVFEFSLKVDNHTSSDALELMAFEVGLSLANQAEVKNIICYMDSLNCVKKINRNIKNFQNNEVKIEKVEHISRKFNIYANALAKLPFNIEYFSSVKLAYHNLNRSKNRFYHRLKEGLEFEIKNKDSFEEFFDISELIEGKSIKNKKVKSDFKKISFRV